MKFNIYLIVFTFLSFWAQSQNCDYVNPRYGVRNVKNIFLGTELDYRLLPDSLFVDIYYPVGDPEAKRPLVMLSFGGGFIGGARQDLAPLCEEFAKRGFVAATIDYRIGFDGISILATDSAEILRAGFRGAQDGKSALRYLKSRHVEDSIDLNRVWVGGVSAGSIVALATAFLSRNEEKPKEAGMINSVGGRMRPDLGPIEGTRFIGTYDSKVQGVFNLFGALLNPENIEPGNQIAVMSYHQTDDPVVPCGAKKPYYGTPLVANNYPTAYGSCVIEQRLKDLNVDSKLHKTWIYTGTEHGIHDQVKVLNFFFEGANPILCNLVSKSEDIKEISDINVYPNPFNEEIIVDGISACWSYQLSDLTGTALINGKLSSSKKISTTGIKNGMYVLTFYGQNKLKSFKLTKI
ncbi:MAG: alpha/beta hydrolase fold domain-containing protein [Saprospiraceae bacterium]|nr:alpha/beta hydrolase fold domain-containing protein [Candidatus Vicinibacter affinis]